MPPAFHASCNSADARSRLTILRCSVFASPTACCNLEMRSSHSAGVKATSTSPSCSKESASATNPFTERTIASASWSSSLSLILRILTSIRSISSVALLPIRKRVTRQVPSMIPSGRRQMPVGASVADRCIQMVRMLFVDNLDACRRFPFHFASPRCRRNDLVRNAFSFKAKQRIHFRRRIWKHPCRRA